ncbi:hypothetical protein VHEMI05455 [[Torrubiella] hemipterigena]|uniref:Peptidase M14 domain-containing protein n=1 Tax=[Torrubiella] hemipterigena TaxID=1531966 RepID=A0A0A1TGP7_9HYPO|nr:hypothetical protein VHEMI05455 [[Torrubiella] hemipterigena]
MIVFLEMVAKEQKVKLFVDWHSYSQLVMSRYGYNCDKKPARDADLMGLAKSAADAFGKAKGAQYKGSRACEIMYVTSGGSTHFVLEKIGAEYSYTQKFRDKGQKGLHIAPERDQAQRRGILRRRTAHDGECQVTKFG